MMASTQIAMRAKTELKAYTIVPPWQKQRAFTLVEVLVALAILAIALAAAVRATSLAVDSANESKLRTLATWLAQDRIAISTALTNTGERLPPVGESNEVRNSAGLDFNVQTKISDTPNPAFRKLDVRVLRPNDSQTLVTMTGYLVLQSAAAKVSP